VTNPNWSSKKNRRSLHNKPIELEAFERHYSTVITAQDDIDRQRATAQHKGHTLSPITDTETGAIVNAWCKECRTTIPARYVR